MKTGKLILVLGGFTIFVLCSSCSRSQKTPGTTELMEEDAFTGPTITDQPEAYFHLAEEAFTHKNYKESADALDAAVRLMEDISKGAGPEDKQAIDNSIAEIRDLSSDVAVDKVDGIRELTFFTGKAFLTLARYRLNATREFMLKDMVPEAADHLNQAILNYHTANQYHGAELTAEEKVATKELEGIAKKLENGVAVDQEEVDRVFSQFETALARLKANSYEDLSL